MDGLTLLVPPVDLKTPVSTLWRVGSLSGGILNCSTSDCRSGPDFKTLCHANKHTSLTTCNKWASWIKVHILLPDWEV